MGKHKSVLILLLASLLGALVFSTACLAYSGKVVQVPGGDMLVVSSAGSVREVRLYGIACPVFGQPFHQRARFLTNFLSLQKNVEITPVFRDVDGIENVLVRIDGVAEYLNSQLVGYGLAWVKPCDPRSRLCKEWKKQEGFAQMNFIGLWAQPPAIAPWDWKKAERMQIYERGMKSSKPRQ